MTITTITVITTTLPLSILITSITTMTAYIKAVPAQQTQKDANSASLPDKPPPAKDQDPSIQPALLSLAQSSVEKKNNRAHIQ
ncbi:hypothetical protein BDW42DRAFT_170211 [Aspergillus taichungensis]|uniref:Uncharacterized protein n=1 Tax=Aspergillus taichungensis TaxID=482145 RepID=A0A2J5HU36_9EURO|nr:hypothetical protein BDW42DRAFT_170211 [Aspergillus taichungensis]